MASEKTRKVPDENRTFHERWEDSYFVIQSQANASGKCQIQIISVLKEYNIKWNYNSQHKHFDKFEGKLRFDKLCQLKSFLSQQKHAFNKGHRSSEDVKKNGNIVSQMIAKTSHPFTEGQLFPFGKT
ncbi:general transcription factor II-I repeat domain-containing protein 2-like [Octopus sinensis]|uniref:General transcription factor II-I repeat domain-containing protein 2-like n=1 Tax=Octopus sinensis TaxID=2607531 RepID=A0A6P7SQN0_9MOLL|nr:general transcription factor II-I repeat domain-containing protein 2-like [Octopus sinensis]